MYKRFWRAFWGHDRSLNDQQFLRNLVEILQRQDRMLEVVEQTECERDIKLSDRAWVEFVNIQSAKLNVEAEGFSNKQTLAHVLALTVDSQHALCAESLGLEGVEPRIATDVQQRLAI